MFVILPFFFLNSQSSNETWNPHLKPQMSHVLTVGYLVLTLHLIDRQVKDEEKIFNDIDSTILTFNFKILFRQSISIDLITNGNVN